MRRLVALLLAGVTLLAGCSAGAAEDHTPDKKASNVGARSSPTTGGPAFTDAPLPADDQYVALARALGDRGVRVWWETDLVSSWLDGPQSFAKTVERLGSLAKVPGVVGFKVADEMGYNDGLDSTEKIKSFLRAARDALSQVAPGKKLLVDMIVPELGCVGLQAYDESHCVNSWLQKYPALTVPNVTGYLRSGAIDTLDLSTGLLEPSQYAADGTTPQRAQEAAWAHVRDLGWPSLTDLQARKALAEAGGYAGSSGQAAQDIGTFVDAPIAGGARAVDIWTWRQPYDGAEVSLLRPDLSPNPLWDDLRQRKQRGDHFFTHMTPSAMSKDHRAWVHECDVASEVFGSVFVAAGTG